MRSADSFFSLVEKASHQTVCKEPALPRKRKAPKHLEVGSSEGFHSASIQEYYRQLYFEVLDLVVTGITTEIILLRSVCFSSTDSCDSCNKCS